MPLECPLRCLWLTVQYCPGHLLWLLFTALCFYEVFMQALLFVQTTESATWWSLRLPLPCFSFWITSSPRCIQSIYTRTLGTNGLGFHLWYKRKAHSEKHILVFKDLCCWMLYDKHRNKNHRVILVQNKKNSHWFNGPKGLPSLQWIFLLTLNAKINQLWHHLIKFLFHHALPASSTSAGW